MRDRGFRIRVRVPAVIMERVMPDLTESSPWLDRSVKCIAYLGVILIGFDASPYGPAPMAIGTSLLLAGLPLLYWRGLSIRFKDPLIILAILLASWVLLRGVADLLFPFMDPAHYNAESFWYHFRASGAMALLVGLWIYAVPGSALCGIGAMMAGMFVHPWHMQFWTELAAALSGQYRLNMNMNPHVIGKYTGIMFLIGVLFFAYGVYFGIKRICKRASWALILSSLYLIPLYLLLFITTKSCLGWIAGVVTLAVLIILMVHKFYSFESANKRNTIYWVSGIALAIVLMSLPFANTVTNLFIQDHHSLKAAATFQFDEVQDESIAMRMMFWQAAVKDISEYPLRGWGPGFVNHVSMLSENEKISATNTHNTYIQFAVSMGLFWTAIWIAFHALLIARAAKATNRLTRNAFIAEIGLTISIFFLVSGLAQFVLHNSNGFSVYLFGTSLLVGIALMNYRENTLCSSSSTKQS